MNNLSPLDYLVRALDKLSTAYQKTNPDTDTPERKAYKDLGLFVHDHYSYQEVENAFYRLYVPARKRSR